MLLEIGNIVQDTIKGKGLLAPVKNFMKKKILKKTHQ